MVNTALSQQVQDVSEAFPQIHAYQQPDGWSLRGGYAPVVGDVMVDWFQVDVRVTRHFPRELPIVFETAGRIPRTPDAHTNPDGSACVGVDEEIALALQPERTLLKFFCGPMNAYFVGQAHYLKFGAWPFGERAHGDAGIVEFYEEALGPIGRDGVLRLLEYLCHRNGVKGHWLCPCGSDKKLRSCHPSIFNLAERIPPYLAARTLQRLRG